MKEKRIRTVIVEKDKIENRDIIILLNWICDNVLCKFDYENATEEEFKKYYKLITSIRSISDCITPQPNYAIKLECEYNSIIKERIMRNGIIKLDDFINDMGIDKHTETCCPFPVSDELPHGFIEL